MIHGMYRRYKVAIQLSIVSSKVSYRYVLTIVFSKDDLLALVVLFRLQASIAWCQKCDTGGHECSFNTEISQGIQHIAHAVWSTGSEVMVDRSLGIKESWLSTRTFLLASAKIDTLLSSCAVSNMFAKPHVI